MSVRTSTDQVRIRDLLHNDVHVLSAQVIMLRVPHEFVVPKGAIRYAVPFIEYERELGGVTVVDRARAAALGSASPGERVLVLLPNGGVGPAEWCLCLVESVEGNASN